MAFGIRISPISVAVKGCMPPDELIAALRADIDTVFRDIDLRFDLDGPVRRVRVNEEPWCTDEVLEHVMLANKYLLILIEKGTNRAVRAYGYRQYDLPAILSSYRLANELFETIGINGSFNWKAPEHMIPAGNADMNEVRGVLRRQQRKLHAVLDRIPHGEGALAMTHMSVLKLGRLDVYQYIYFLVLHMRRHLQQIDSICKMNNTCNLSEDGIE